MLSGLTSQLGGLITSVKAKAGESNTPTSEDGATPTAPDPAAEQTLNKSRSGSTSGADGATASATGGGVGAGAAAGIMNLRSSLPSWLGGGGAKDDPSAATPQQPTTNQVDKDPHSDAGSSDTGGADSEKERTLLDELSSNNAAAAAGGAAPPTTERIKNVGSFLFSTIKGAGQKIKDTAKSSMSGSGVAPWVGHVKEEALKEEVLGLSGDRRNFVRSPPTGVSFEWNYEEMLPVAKAILKEDPNLEKMRYELVPKMVSEENFWRNYFYRVMLLKGSLESESQPKKQDSIDTDEEEEVVDAELEKELNEELKGFEVVKKTSEKDLDFLK
ncbi:synapse-associated protein of 47 kDa isoform X2 [Folsomia candida]|uniref:synapse-associated protein of 47 kDa isoform X2 n=1 Tax=Folsomia candida TaxID=158441 RepID=UPI000B8FE463|nr:synapse-associated protein of 47 kDa isoform X2 [Folsomia candida]